MFSSYALKFTCAKLFKMPTGTLVWPSFTAAYNVYVVQNKPPTTEKKQSHTVLLSVARGEGW